MSKTCPYCASAVAAINTHFYCDFCEMNIPIHAVCENGRRKNSSFRPLAFRDWLDKTTPELMTHHIVELLFLLKEVRKLRADYYSTLRTFNKGYSEASGEDRELLAEVKEIQGMDYEQITRKGFVLENIIQQRIGYVPSRIDDRFLASYIEKCEKPLREMIIRKESEKFVAKG